MTQVSEDQKRGMGMSFSIAKTHCRNHGHWATPGLVLKPPELHGQSPGLCHSGLLAWL
jgi:hypothetical protein